MEAILLIIMCVGCVSCFLVGAKVGQAASKGEKIETPSLNPLRAVRENEERKAAKREEERLNTIMENIENYDGTSRHQKQIP